MRILLHGAVATLAVATLCTATATAQTTASAAPAWAATATKAVTYQGTLLGATAPTTPLHLAVTLAPRQSAEMTAALKAIYTPGSAAYQQYLTPAQWTAAYAPTADSVAAVTRYLTESGFTDVTATGNRLVVTADGTAADAEQAFHTSLADYRLGTRTVYGNTTAASVPPALAGVVSAVVGLNDLPLDAVSPTVRAAGSPDVGDGLYPAQFETTYDAVGTGPGTGTSIALLTEGDTSGVLSALRYAEAQEKVPQTPVTVVDVGAQSTDTSGADEFDMDSQVSTIVSGGVKRLYMYNIGSLVDAQVDADFATFVAQDRAQALSASIGGCEVNSYLDGSELTTDIVMQEGAMQGQSLFASSGDNGDACMYVAALGAPAGVPGVNWPASGEFDTAVGGTSLVTDADGNRVQELGWAGSGGGLSDVENPGWWTQDTDPAYDAQYVTGGRAVPDVALDADPNVATPAKVYVGTTLSYVGGTSLSSPMMLGFWARLESAHGNRLGLASIPLYRAYDAVNPGTSEATPAGVTVVVPPATPSQVPGFTDIVAGSNGLYTTAPGYDLVTGLGAPDVKALDAVIG